MLGWARRVAGGAIGLFIVLRHRDVIEFDRTVNAVLAVLIVATTIVLADVLPAARSSVARPGQLATAILGGALAIGLSVPETDHLPAVLLVPLVLVAIEAAARIALPVIVHAASIALLIDGGVLGSAGFSRALMMVSVAWWALAIVPVAVVSTRPRVTNPLPARQGWGVVAVGSITVIAISRTGGINNTTSVAVTWAVVLIVLSIPLARRVVAGGTPAEAG